MSCCSKIRKTTQLQGVNGLALQEISNLTAINYQTWPKNPKETIQLTSSLLQDQLSSAKTAQPCRTTCPRVSVEQIAPSWSAKNENKANRTTSEAALPRYRESFSGQSMLNMPSGLRMKSRKFLRLNRQSLSPHELEYAQRETQRACSGISNKNSVILRNISSTRRIVHKKRDPERFFKRPKF